jgi:hypothetical protein
MTTLAGELNYTCIGGAFAICTTVTVIVFDATVAHIMLTNLFVSHSNTPLDSIPF